MGKKILIADDNRFYSKLYKSELEKRGHEIKVVEDGSLALKALKEYKPDILLLDIIMPKMDGFDTIAKIRSDKSLSGLKILVFSTLSQEEDIKKTKDLGANAYLPKYGSSMDEILTQIENFL